MEERIKMLENRIDELKSWKNQLQAQARKRVWARRIGNFLTLRGVYKIIRGRDTFASNFLMGAGFVAGLNASSDVRTLNQNAQVADVMIEDKEKEIQIERKLVEEKKKEEAKQLTLKPVQQ